MKDYVVGTPVSQADLDDEDVPGHPHHQNHGVDQADVHVLVHFRSHAGVAVDQSGAVGGLPVALGVVQAGHRGHDLTGQVTDDVTTEAGAGVQWCEVSHSESFSHL